jgi:hypothetical protein
VAVLRIPHEQPRHLGRWGRTPRALSSRAMALSVPAPVRSMIRLHRFSSRGCRSAEASTGLNADELCFRLRVPFFPATWDRSRPGSERAAGRQSPFPSMALFCGQPATRAFGGGARYARACFSVVSSRDSLSSGETRKTTVRLPGALPAAQGGDTGRGHRLTGGEEARPQLSQCRIMCPARASPSFPNVARPSQSPCRASV